MLLAVLFIFKRNTSLIFGRHFFFVSSEKTSLPFLCGFRMFTGIICFTKFTNALEKDKYLAAVDCLEHCLIQSFIDVFILQESRVQKLKQCRLLKIWNREVLALFLFWFFASLYALKQTTETIDFAVWSLYPKFFILLDCDQYLQHGKLFKRLLRNSNLISLFVGSLYALRQTNRNNIFCGLAFLSQVLHCS